MVLDAEVADAIDSLAGCDPGTGALDHNSRGLLPAPVATGGLTRFERSDQALDERADGLLVRPRHLVDDRRPSQDVPLDGEAGADAMAGPVVALRAREGGGAAVGSHDPELARLPPGV